MSEQNQQDAEPMTIGAMLAANLKGEANYTDEEMTLASLAQFTVPGKSTVTAGIGNIIGVKDSSGNVTIFNRNTPQHG